MHLLERKVLSISSRGGIRDCIEFSFKLVQVPLNNGKSKGEGPLGSRTPDFNEVVAGTTLGLNTGMRGVIKYTVGVGTACQCQQ